ncbi:hypothetical protein [uncultured Parabacteroides sp.]|uniref:hypothetical protein n=1 Tax=uncultured Parabacteroides sp. TaxID=512312 RepID=UPI0025F4EAA1|nr:hypothetical protein [uncultured Parabacteroides sp.]
MTFVKAEQSLLYIPTMLNSRRIEYLKRGRGWDRNRVRIKRVFLGKPAHSFHRDRPNRHYDRPNRREVPGSLYTKDGRRGDSP